MTCQDFAVTPGTAHAQSRPASQFYRRVMLVLMDGNVDFLVGGAFAFVRYTGLSRDTKDLDLFVRRRDWPRVTALLAQEGIDTDLTFPHWLGKAFGGRDREFFVDIIFSGGNGVAEVDDLWFEHAPQDSTLGFAVRLMPVEEMIWSKAFIMERERFDGADVIHLIRARQHDLDWQRLVRRFGEHWRVLLAHLILFSYIYPTEPVQQAIVDELVQRLKSDPSAEIDVPLCRGTLLSRAQYLDDVERLHYVDARIAPQGAITPEDAALWTNAIDGD
jgi:hypothetical protein